MLAGTEHREAIPLVLQADVGEFRVFVRIGTNGDVAGHEVGLHHIAL